MSGFEPRQVVFVHQGVWDGFSRWLIQNRLELFVIPADEADLPSYGIRPVDLL